MSQRTIVWGGEWQAIAGCVGGSVGGQRGVVTTRAVPRFVGGAPVKVPPMIGVPLVLFLMTPPPWRRIAIQYLVSQVSFTTWYLNLKATQIRDAIVEEVDRVLVLCPRATHVGMVPWDIVVVLFRRTSQPTEGKKGKSFMSKACSINFNSEEYRQELHCKQNSVYALLATEDQRKTGV